MDNYYGRRAVGRTSILIFMTFREQLKQPPALDPLRLDITLITAYTFTTAQERQQRPFPIG